MDRTQQQTITGSGVTSLESVRMDALYLQASVVMDALSLRNVNLARKEHDVLHQLAKQIRTKEAGKVVHDLGNAVQYLILEDYERRYSGSSV